MTARWAYVRCSIVGSSVQVIVDAGLPDYPQVARAHTGASVEVRGRLVESKGAGQKWEVVATQFTVVGEADGTYPLQKKGHTLEFLREISHLRPRSNLFGAVFRVRSRLAYAVHQFFQEKGFAYVHAPIITASDCEGAGQLFRVTAIDHGSSPRTDNGQVDYSQDFFGRSFGIESEGAPAHTGCLGFGYERLALAFLAQHGLHESSWPSVVRDWMRG